MRISFEKIWHFLFSNIMWLYIIMGVCTCFLGIYPMTFQLFMLSATLLFIQKLNKIRITNLLDLFVTLFLLWILINSILIDYPHKFRLFYTAVMSNIIPMLFYYIAKTTNYDLEEILRKATVPIVIAMVLGLIFYYTNPGWYVAIKMRQITEFYESNNSDELMIGIFRLSSIWTTPYVIGLCSLEKMFTNR